MTPECILQTAFLKQKNCVFLLLASKKRDCYDRSGWCSHCFCHLGPPESLRTWNLRKNSTPMQKKKKKLNMIVNFWCATTEPTMKTSFTETVRCGWKLVSGSCLKVYKNGVQRTSAHWALPSQFKAFNYLESSTHIYIYLFGRYFDKSDKESKPQ